MNLSVLLTATARACPDRPALSWGSVCLSYAQLQATVDALSAGFRSLGLQQGDRLAFLMPNRPELLETMFAAFAAGLCVVPLNAQFKTEEVLHHLRDSGAAALVFSSGYDEVVQEAVDQLRGAPVLVRLAEDDTPADGARGTAAQRTADYDELVAGHAGSSPVPADVADGDLAWLFYTSGTTGRPKGAMLTVGNLLFAVVGWLADVVPLGVGDVTLHAAPLTHGAGFYALAATAKGAHQVLAGTGRFDPEHVLDLVESAGVTNTWLVPTQINRLVRSPGFQTERLSTLHTVVYGGAPFLLEDLKTAIRRIGPILVQIYGQGETPMTATWLSREDHDLARPDSDRLLRSAGRARTGVEVRVVDAHDRPVPPGTLGEVVVRGSSVMSGYWQRPEASQEVLRGGWLHTGDLGQLDASGYLQIIDRLKDVIITGGANVYAREVEDVLAMHPDVLATAVVGLPDREWGERVVAAVVPRAGSSPSVTDLLGHCSRHLADYKKPKQVHLMDALPVSSYGKILKTDLRAALARADVAPARSS